MDCIEMGCVNDTGLTRTKRCKVKVRFLSSVLREVYRRLRYSSTQILNPPHYVEVSVQHHAVVAVPLG